MSQQLISHSEDLTRLVEDGYDLEIKAKKYLLVKSVPYVNSKREVMRGTLVVELDLAGLSTVAPSSHVAHFDGEHPCNTDGSEISEIKHQSNAKTLVDGLAIRHSFSAKPLPDGKYKDFYHKVVTYVALISAPAENVEPGVNARVRKAVEFSSEDSVFLYPDTTSDMTVMDAVNQTIRGQRIAIVGVGGTGAYVLDLIAKTPVGEIHLFDQDEFHNRNAFRSPGAASLEQVSTRKSKANHFAEVYSKMRHGVIAHSQMITSENLNELQGMNFVFLCLDDGPAKRPVIEYLQAQTTPFIDVGVGVNLVDNRLLGQVRTTLVTQDHNAHVFDKVSTGEANVENEYSSNIQVAELNALNAALAVIKWKKHFGFYLDVEQEHNSTYQIDGNTIVNEERNEN